LAQNELNLKSNGFQAKKGGCEDAESKQMRGTHFLESTDGQTSQDMERIQLSKGTHFLESTDRWTSQDMEKM